MKRELKDYKEYRIYTAYPRNKDSKLHRQSTSGCVGLELSIIFKRLHIAIITSVSTLMVGTQQVLRIIWYEGQKQGKADYLTAISNFSWSSFISTCLPRHKFIQKPTLRYNRNITTTINMVRDLLYLQVQLSCEGQAALNHEHGWYISFHSAEIVHFTHNSCLPICPR
jgi:hypothetical protein